MRKLLEKIRKRCARDESGAAMVEFALVFPLQLLLTLLIIQISLVVVGKQVVNYAAFSAARAAMVEGEQADAERAAKDAATTVCIPIAGTADTGAFSEEVHLPGWTNDNRPDFVTLSNRAREKVDVDVTREDERCEVEVKFAFEMSLPFVGWVIYYAMEAVSPGLVHIEGLDTGDIPDDTWALRIADMPHIVLHEKAVMATPWTGESSQEPHDEITEFDEEEEP